MKKIIIYTAAALLVSGLSGCKDWLDINTDPNNATTALMTEALLLPAQQYDILNNHVNSTNAWQLSHHLTKSGEFSGNYTFLNGQVMPQDLDSWWSTYYSINWNLKFIHDLAVENEDPAYQAISEVLQVINSRGWWISGEIFHIPKPSIQKSTICPSTTRPRISTQT